MPYKFKLSCDACGADDPSVVMQPCKHVCCQRCLPGVILASKANVRQAAGHQQLATLLCIHNMNDGLRLVAGRLLGQMLPLQSICGTNTAP